MRLHITYQIVCNNKAVDIFTEKSLKFIIAER